MFVSIYSIVTESLDNMLPLSEVCAVFVTFEIEGNGELDYKTHSICQSISF